MHQNGVVVYLTRELSKLETGGRPLSQENTVEELYNRRRAAYERFADVTVTGTETPELTADAMIKALGFSAEVK